MTPKARSRLLLGATLLLGMVLGILLINAIGMLLGPPGPGRGPRGFVGEMERLLQPRDGAQREALLPALEAVDGRNREILDDARLEMVQALVEMREEIAPLLDEDQLRRLDDFIAERRRDPPGGGPPGAGPPGGPPPRRPRR